MKRVLQTDTAGDRTTGIQDIALPAATAPPANRSGDNSETPALATEFQALRKEFDALRAVIDGNYNPCSYAQVTAGLHSQRGKRNRKKAQVEDKQQQPCRPDGGLLPAPQPPSVDNALLSAVQALPKTGSKKARLLLSKFESEGDGQLN